MAGPISETRWRPLGSIDPFRLKEARLQAHYALQWLARTARAYIPPQPDDSHTCLYWDDARDAFATQNFAGGARILLRIPTLTLTVQGDEGEADSQSFALDRRTDAQVREWLGKQLEARRLAPAALDEPAPYEIPAHAVAQGAVYEPRAEADGLAVLAAWYANAAVLIDSVRRRIAGERLAVSALCCWPHHFDLAILAMLSVHHSAELGLIGIGLSPGDEYYDEPYFYVSVYPEPKAQALPALPPVGNWHTRDFTAAVAPAQKILAAKNAEIETGRFLDEAVGASLGLLSQAPEG
jgi:predicted anti-sigma-YlaC factor YlaD